MATSASTPRRGRKVNAAQALGLLAAFAVVASVGGVVAAGLVLPAVATTSAMANTTTQIFDELPAELTQVPLSEKSTILAADGTLLATFYDQNRIVVPLSEISVDMINAVIDTEDKRFFEHGGVDLTGMTRALLTNAVSDSKEGASTLTQQYVKNAQIQAALQIDDPVERAQAIADARADTGLDGYARKLQEAKLAISLEKVMTKEEILQAYLNISQFGVSVYGVETAAQYYFSVSAKDLDYLQAATIAGITKGPTEYDPERNPEKSQNRRDTVLSLMLKQGDITQEQFDTGVATPIGDTLKLGQTRLGCMTAGSVVAGSGYFCDYVTKIIAQNPAFGETAADRRRLLYQGGLTIHTTLDPRLQELADAAVKNAVPVDDPSGVSDAMSTVEPGTGKILAMAQNRNYNTAPNPGPGESAVNYNTDYDYGGSQGFQPGSTFKAFTLLEWLKEGHALQEVVDGRVKTYKMSDFHSSCTGFGGKDWRPNNAEGNGNFMSVADATRNSVNNAFVDMATPARHVQDLPGCAGARRAHRLGRRPQRPARQRPRDRLRRTVDDGRGVRGVLGRRHLLRADRDHGGRGQQREVARGALGELPAGDHPADGARDDLRHEPGVERDRQERREAPRRPFRLGQDGHHLGERVHLVRRLHRSALDRRVGRPRRGLHPDAADDHRRDLLQERLRVEHRRTRLARVHGTGERGHARRRLPGSRQRPGRRRPRLGP